MRATVTAFRRRNGFSLIEILMVIAVIGVLLASTVRQPRRDDAGPALRAAEAEVARLLSLTRTHALRLNRAARLLIELEPASDGGGQRLCILSIDPDDGTWQPIGPFHRLGPQAVVVTEELLGSELVGGGIVSTFHGTTTFGRSDEPSYDCGYVHFSSTGTSFGTVQLVVAPARRSAEGWTIHASQRARRLLVRPGGAVTARSASALP